MSIQKTIVALVAMLGSLWGWAQGYEARIAALDVLNYQFIVDISDTSDIIRCDARVNVEFKQATDHVLLDLVAAVGNGKGMKVKSTLDATNPIQLDLAFTHTGELLRIDLGKTVDIGTVMDIRIFYEGIPADGLIITQNERDGRSFFGDNWPNRAHHWLPTVDHPSEKATLDMTVIAPAHFEIVGNGTLIYQRVVGNNKQVSHWRNKEPLPTKVMVFGAADFAMQNVGDAGGVPVSTWVFEKDEVNGFKDYAQGRRILQWYVDHIAPYPWEKLANVQSRTRYGGMENASCIFYADNSVTGDSSCEALMAHEIAHQWFGNSASEANWYHIWLSEGFATYLTHVYFESVHGEEIFLQRMAADRREIVGSPVAAKLAVVDPRIQDLNQLLNINSYQKGGWVLHMLRQRLGDDLFFKGIQNYYRRFQYGNALSEDLQKVMEEESGQDLASFFKQWLYRPAFPKLDVVWAWKKGKTELSLTITQTQEGDPFDFPLEIAALDAHGNTIGMLTQAVHSKTQKASLILPQMPAKLVLDPKVKLLFEGKVRQK
jgi:aminopeptidase N